MMSFKTTQFLPGDYFYCIDYTFLCWKFIIYSLFIYCSLDSNHHPSDLKWRKKCKILRGFEPASFKSIFHAATTEL